MPGPLAHHRVLGAQHIRIIINRQIYCTHHYTYHLIHTLCLEYHSVAGEDRTGFWPFRERGNVQHLNGLADHHVYTKECSKTKPDSLEENYH